MQKIPNQLKYGKTIWLYAASRTLERTAFYGMRSILFLYMVNGPLLLPETTGQGVYNILIQGVVFFGVLGAVVGDLIFGNRKALLAGGCMLSMGLSLLAVPHKHVFYAAVGLIIFGCGLYTPNFIARFGKQFYDKPELTDGGFSLLYVLANLGGLLGAGIITLFAHDVYYLGFAICGVLMIGATLLAFVNKDSMTDETKPKPVTSATHRGLIITGTILIVGLYWCLYDVSYDGIQYLQGELQAAEGWQYIYIWSMVSYGFILPLGVAFALLYSFFTFNKVLKLVLGFILSALGLGILTFVTIPDSGNLIPLLFFSFLLLNLGEMIMAPVLFSVITQKANPKYLALILSLSLLPLTLLRLVLPASFTQKYIDDSSILQVTSPIIAAIGLIILIAWLVTKTLKGTKTQQ